MEPPEPDTYQGRREQSLRKECRQEENEVLARASRSVEGAVTPKNITPDCELIRLIQEQWFAGGRVSSIAFMDHRMSVYVKGRNFEPIDVAALLSDHRQQGRLFVGAVKFSASVVINDYKLLHDPNPWSKGHGEDVAFVPQHPNHAQVICVKGRTVASTIQQSSRWEIEPSSGE